MSKKEDLKKEVDKADEKFYRMELKQVHMKKHHWYILSVVMILLVALFIVYLTLQTDVMLFIVFGYCVFIVFLFILSQLIDCGRKMFKEGYDTEKQILWFVVILCLPLIGSLFHWFLKK